MQTESSNSHSISVKNKDPTRGRDVDLNNEHTPLLAQQQDIPDQQQQQLSEWYVIIPLCSIMFCGA